MDSYASFDLLFQIRKTGHELLPYVSQLRYNCSAVLEAIDWTHQVTYEDEAEILLFIHKHFWNL